MVRSAAGCSHRRASPVSISPPSLLAMKIGGLPLLWGMTIFAGLVEIALSRVWTRLRTFIPSETAGLVVFLIGVNVGLAALRTLIGNSVPGTLSGESAGVAGVALAVMIGLNIWNKGQLRLFCILIGMMVGYVAAVAAGMLTLDDFMSVLRQPLFAFPSVAHVSFAFDPALIIPFAVCGIGGCDGIDCGRHHLSADHRCRLGAPGHDLDPARHIRRRDRSLDRRAAWHLWTDAGHRQCRPGGGHRRREPAYRAHGRGHPRDRSGPARLRGGADHHAAAGDGVRRCCSRPYSS